MTLHPIIIFQEMVNGVLQWDLVDHDSDAFSMVEMLDPTAKGLQPYASISDYERVMEPVYQQMQEQLTVRNGQRFVQIHDPVKSHSEYAYKSNASDEKAPLRYTQSIALKTVDKKTWIWQTIISKESERLLKLVHDRATQQQDNDIYLFDIHNTQDILNELVEQLSRKEQDDIQQFLMYELSALWEELNFRKRLLLAENDMHQSPSFSSRVPVLKTPEWWKHQVFELLDQWVVKYYNTAPVAEICHFLNEMLHQQNETEKHVVQTQNNDNMSRWIRHLQIILLLIIIKKISTNKDKKLLPDLNKVEHMFKTIVEKTDVNEAEDLGSVLEQSYLLDEADEVNNISRYPVIQDYMQIIRHEIKETFSKSKETSAGNAHPNYDPNGTPATFMDRLKHDYITFQELLDYTQLTPGALRKQFKNYGINTTKRGDIIYISYDEYFKR